MSLTNQFRRLRPIRLAVAVATGCLMLHACASGNSGDSGSATRVTGGSGTDCIINRGIRRFERLDNRNLIVYAAGSRAYHVELATPSQNLDSEIVIEFADDDGRICPDARDAILIRGPFLERIPLSRIDAIRDEDIDDLKNRYGAFDPDD